MDELMKKARDRFYSEFTQMYSEAAPKDKWPKECVETMKDLLKCIYYCDVLEAMHQEQQYGEDRGSSYTGGNGYSSAQRRNAMGQFSRNGSYNSYPTSGRRYYSYDDERHSVMDRLQRMMDGESNEEVRMALQNAMAELNMR